MNKFLPYFDGQKVQNWLENSQHLEIRRVKQKILDNVTFIDEKTFDKAIIYATKKFTKEIRNQKYIVLWDNELYSSKRWVFTRVLNLLENTQLKFGAYCSEYKLHDKLYSRKISNFVIFDDAIYSGDQIFDQIYDINNRIKRKNDPNFSLTFHIVITCIAKKEFDLINELKNNFNVDVKLYYFYNIKMINEIFSDKAIELIKTEQIIHIDTPLTYFFHMIPDDKSFPDEIQKLMNKPEKPYNRNTEYGRLETIEWERFQKENSQN